MKKTLLSAVSSLFGVAAIMALGTASCGRPDDANLNASQRNDSYTPVDGLGAYGSQCPYGDVGDVKPLRLQMWSCPISASSIHLNEDLEPLYLEADCKSRILSVRTLNHKVDTSWYFLPNGDFDVVVDGVVAKLKDDGNGHKNCNAPLAINLMGHVECGPAGPNQDKATIKFQSVMWAGKRLNTQGANPVVAPSSTPGLPPPPIETTKISNQCSLPASCYFYTQTDLKQCQ